MIEIVCALMLNMFAFIKETDAVNIGIICETSPYSWQYLFRSAGAISIAQDKLIQEGIIDKNTIEK